MKAIYVPKGAALEYARLATNPYLTCEHGCRYCYVPGVLHMTRDVFCRPPVLREGYLEALERELPDYSLDAGNSDPIHIGFVCDPYSPGEDGQTRQVLEAFVRHNVPFTLLTKGGMRAVRDFDLLQGHAASLGVTMTGCESTRMEWEPGAAPVSDRERSLVVAHEAGIPTWVSIEPVLVPEEALWLIGDLPRCFGVDEIRVGRVNHLASMDSALVENYGLRDVDWTAFANMAYDALVASGVERFTLKRGLVELLDEQRAEGYRELHQGEASADAPGAAGGAAGAAAEGSAEPCHLN